MIGQGCNAPGATAVGAPSMPSPTRCWPSASGRCPRGAGRPSCSASRARLGVSRGRGVSRAALALVGAGGGGMPPSPTRGRASGRAPLKRMNCRIRLATKAKPHTAGSSRWGAGRVGVVSRLRLAVALRTKPAPPASRGAAARGWSAAMPAKIAPARRGRRRPIGRSKRAGDSPQTPRAALGRCRARGRRSSSTRSRHRRVVMGTRSGRSACLPCSNPPCAWGGVSASATCRAPWASCNACGTIGSRMPASRPS